MAVTCGKMSDKYIADFRYEGEINDNYTFKEDYRYSHAWATYTLT
jgi:outer membrane receptor for monomeric catechols